MRKILVVIDMQNDFIDGALGTPEALAIVENVKNKIRQYPAENVCATMDTHGEDYLDTQEGKLLPVKHCIKGTEGWKIRDDIAELLAGAKIYEKPTFGSVELAQDLAKEMKAVAGAAADIAVEVAGMAGEAADMSSTVTEEAEIEIIGLCTDICVVSNALLIKAFAPETKISVDPSCCAGVTPEKHKAALETMRSCQIIVEE